MDFKKELGIELKNMRTQAGLSQAAFAGVIKIPLKTYQRWEQEGCKFYIYNLICLAYEEIVELAKGFDPVDCVYIPTPEPEQVEIADFDNIDVLDYPWDSNFWCFKE